MSLKHVWIAGILLLLIVGSAGATASTCGVVTADYNVTSNTINTSGALSCLSGINATINNPVVLNETSPGVWLLNAIINTSATDFYMNESDAVWLKLNSTSGNVVYINRYSGNLKANITKITSWNTSTNSEETLIDSVAGYATPRAYITSASSSGICSFTNSNLSYLGYNSFGNTGIYCNHLRGTSTFTFINNTVIGNAYGVQIRGGQYHNISYNTITNSLITGIYISDSTKSSIVNNNTISNITDIDQAISSYGIYLIRSNSGLDVDKIYNMTVRYNSITNIKYGIVLKNNTNNSDITKASDTITNNTIDTVDTGIYIISPGQDRGSLNIGFNSINNATRGDDQYDIGILVDADNITINDEIITAAGSAGICICQNNGNANITLSNNYIDLWNPILLNQTNVFDTADLPTAIRISPEFKTYATSGFIGSVNWSNHFSTRIVNGLIISNNTFGSNVTSFAHINSASNVTHDLTNYYLVNYSYPELFTYVAEYINTSNRDAYHYGNYVNRSYTSGESYSNPNHKYIDQRAQVRYFNSTNDFIDVYWGYIINSTGVHFQAHGIKYGVSSYATINKTNIPYTITLYSPASYIFYGTPSKNITIFSNGTSQFQLYNDTLEPNWYSQVNASITPSSDSITVNITAWNTTGDYYKKWNESSANASVTTQHVIGDNPVTSYILIKRDGVDFARAVSNSTGYITWNYGGNYITERQFEFIYLGSAKTNPFTAVEVAAMATAATIALYTYYRKRGRGRIYVFIPFL